MRPYNTEQAQAFSTALSNRHHNEYGEGVWLLYPSLFEIGLPDDEEEFIPVEWQDTTLVMPSFEGPDYRAHIPRRATWFQLLQAINLGMHATRDHHHIYLEHIVLKEHEDGLGNELRVELGS